MIKKIYRHARTNTNRKLSALLLFILFVALFLSGCNKPDPPKIALSEKSWYYGEVTPDERPSHEFTIKNEGGEKLIIESVYSSCPCVIIDLSENEIGPGDLVSLRTIFDPTGYEGEVSKNITIKSNDSQNPEKTIKASITVLRVPNPDIEISEQTFNLGDISREEKALIDFTIFNTGDADLIIEEIVSEELFSYNFEIPLTIPSDKEFHGQLTIDTEQLKEGEFRKAVRIMTNDPQNPAVFLRIQGNAQ